jgi:hypothetical protein
MALRLGESKKKAGTYAGLLLFQLLLLLAFGVRVIGMLACRLRVLLRTLCMLLALRVVALAVMFGGRTMGLSSLFVMLGGLIVLVSSHGSLVGWSVPVRRNSWFLRTFLISRFDLFGRRMSRPIRLLG